MKKSIFSVCVSALLLLGSMPAMAQFNIGKAAGGATKVLKAAHIKQMPTWQSM